MLDRKLTISSPAKVNLYLGVRAEICDGYHQLDSVFHTIDIHDTLTFEVHTLDKPADRAGRMRLSCEPALDVPTPSNLVYRAMAMFSAAAGNEPLAADQQLVIHMVKTIPLRAGMGGGSSNGAAAIMACCRLWGIEPSSSIATDVASRLGADVSFFLHGGCAHMQGKGDEFVEDFEALRTPLVVVKVPDMGVSTSAAYHTFDKAPIAPSDVSIICDALRGTGEQRVVGVAEALENNLEPAARIVEPRLSSTLEWLAQQPGVVASLLCGSGSAAFALVESAQKAEDIAHAALQRNLWAAATHLSSEGVSIEEDLVLA